MTNQIVLKLNNVLNEGKFSEPIVVYIMAGIRKMIEQRTDREVWQKLNFYCNWALHHKLSKDSARLFVKQFEELYQRIQSNSLESSYIEAEDITKFKFFREEMSNFLEINDIFDFTKDVDLWLRFKIEYLGVITDCPLEAKSDNISDSLKDIIVDVQKKKKDGLLIIQTNWNITPKKGPRARFYIIDAIEN